eukprot:TRINITY_DN51600_c0_g1_i1.p1 TRINITY_DN51600_c0_g1~~TRINITY_DN51600_c0_g1_i1.p1  ORF type:complete len:470 (-),score=65.33 TRINITY_DN51600_c0_g1_i1:598-2007(-)
MSAIISQFFILSPRGDKIIDKDYRFDIIRTTDEIFFRKYKFWDPTAPNGGSSTSTDRRRLGGVTYEAPPFFNVEGVNYTYVKRNNLLFVLTTRHNCSPSLLVEILQRVTKLLKDYLAVLNEDSLRKNFTLVYEILDEVIDFGYIQETSTEKLRPYIFNEPIAVENVVVAKPVSSGGWTSKLGIPGMSGPRTKNQTASNMSVAEKSEKNEIFVDVLEKLNAVFAAGGRVLSCVVDGQIVMKSFLAGSPALKLALNEDLLVGKENKRGYSTTYLDDCNFHECVNYDSFETERLLQFHPPDGEFSVMNYRVTSTEFTLPFKVEPYVETISPYKVEVTLRIRADFPARVHAVNTSAKFPVPKNATNVTVEFGVGALGQTYEYDQTGKMVTWNIKKFDGATEHMMKTRVSLSSPASGNLKKEIGPITMTFEIPNHGVTGVAIRFLKIEERSKSYNPSRWVRNITQANSYTCRVV